jgi:uncharacterized protein YqeY
MSLKGRLQQDMNEVLRAREPGRQRLSAIRMIRAAVLNAEKEARGGDLDDVAVLAVLAREAKRLESAIAEYARLGQSDRAVDLEYELRVVRSYLPQPLSSDELRAFAAEAAAEVGAAGPADMGKVMKALLPKLAGRADGKAASDAVRQLLSR